MSTIASSLSILISFACKNERKSIEVSLARKQKINYQERIIHTFIVLSGLWLPFPRRQKANLGNSTHADALLHVKCSSSYKGYMTTPFFSTAATNFAVSATATLRWFESLWRATTARCPLHPLLRSISTVRGTLALR